MLGKIKGRKRRGRQMMRWWDGITDTMDMGLGRLWELVMDREACHAAVHPMSTTKEAEHELLGPERTSRCLPVCSGHQIPKGLVISTKEGRKGNRKRWI